MKVIFTGRIVRDAEKKVTAKGTSLVSFTVPDEIGFGDNKKTQWVRCSLFGKRAEGKLVDYLVKGQWLQIMGDLSINTYTAQEGQNKASLDVLVDDVKILWGSSETPSETPSEAPTQPSEDDLNEDIPF